MMCGPIRGRMPRKLHQDVEVGISQSWYIQIIHIPWLVIVNLP